VEVCEAVHEITSHGRAAQDCTFQRQIRDAAKAAAPLIAEGFRRFTPAEFVRYLRMAAAEIAEVQTHLEFAHRQGYFSADEEARASTLAKRASVATIRLLKSKLPLLTSTAKGTKRQEPGRA
jgi:four helix bundle protein